MSTNRQLSPMEQVASQFGWNPGDPPLWSVSASGTAYWRAEEANVYPHVFQPGGFAVCGRCGLDENDRTPSCEHADGCTDCPPAHEAAAPIVLSDDNHAEECER
jgi:hypothetical protein